MYGNNDICMVKTLKSACRMEKSEKTVSINLSMPVSMFIAY